VPQCVTAAAEKLPSDEREQIITSDVFSRNDVAGKRPRRHDGLSRSEEVMFEAAYPKVVDMKEITVQLENNSDMSVYL